MHKSEYRRNEKRPQTKVIDGKNYVTVNEAAQALGLSPWWLREMARLKQVPAIKHGTTWYFYVPDVETKIRNGSRINGNQSSRGVDLLSQL